MKFSFDFEKYRKNLAGEIKEKKKESKKEAKDILEKEQKTEKYKTAKEAKAVDFEIKKVESLAKEELEKSEKSNLLIKTIDIKDKIPEKLQIIIDKRRLYEIKMRKKQEVPRISELHFDEETMTEAKKFVNEITNGDFLNPERLNTAIEGYKHGQSSEVFWYFPKNIPRTEAKDIRVLPREKSKDRKSLHEEIYIPVNKSFGPEETVGFSEDEGLWFSAGDSAWWDPTKKLVIVNPYSDRFKNSIYSTETETHAKRRYRDILPKDTKGQRNEELFNKKLKNLVEFANRQIQGGIEVKFKKDENKELKFKDIADWIVDLPNGVIYKIEEKEEEEEQETKTPTPHINPNPPETHLRNKP